MAYVITDACVKDFLCVEECSMDAIAPRASDPRADEVSQVSINPQDCADCGACIAVCEHDAIYPEDSLPADKTDAAAKNAAFFQ